jgi:hypothetical protein
MAVPVTRLLVGLLAGTFGSLAAADEGPVARSVGSGVLSNQIAVIDELEMDLSRGLGDELIAALRVEMNQIVQVIRANPSIGDFNPEWELAAQVEQD